MIGIIRAVDRRNDARASRIEFDQIIGVRDNDAILVNDCGGDKNDIVPVVCNFGLLGREDNLCGLAGGF